MYGEQIKLKCLFITTVRNIHCSIQPAPHAFNESGQKEFVFIQYAFKLINKIKIVLWNVSVSSF